MRADAFPMLPLPYTPANCDLKHLPAMMINIIRLRGSSFDAMADDGAWRAGFNLWFSSWHQAPAASLPDDDEELTKLAGLGRDLRTWSRIKAKALHGWVKCRDGLLYHPVVAEAALEAWLETLGRQMSSGAGNAKRWGGDFDAGPLKAEVAMAAEMLARLNPKSAALGKPHVRSSTNPDGMHDRSQRHPGGTRAGNPTGVRPGSEKNRRENDIPPNPPLAGGTIDQDQFEKALAAFPADGRAACSVDDARSAWASQVPIDVPASNLLLAVRAYAAICRESGQKAMAFHRWLRLKRYQTLLPKPPAPPWDGPDDVRAALIDERGEDYFRAWVQPGGWRDLPTRALVCRTGTAADRLRRDVGRLLASLGVEIVHGVAV